MAATVDRPDDRQPTIATSSLFLLGVLNKGARSMSLIFRRSQVPWPGILRLKITNRDLVAVAHLKYNCLLEYIPRTDFDKRQILRPLKSSLYCLREVGTKIKATIKKTRFRVPSPVHNLHSACPPYCRHIRTFSSCRTGLSGGVGVVSSNAIRLSHSIIACVPARCINSRSLTSARF